MLFRSRPGTDPYEMAQIKWTSTVSPKLMLETGWGFNAIRFITAYQDGIRKVRGTADWFRVVGHRDLGLNTFTVAGTPETNTLTHRNSVYGSATYVTGSHSFKFGGLWSGGPLRSIVDANGDLIQQYRNGVPESVVVYNTPFDTRTDTNHDDGLFAQDTWRKGNVTMNLGVRFDYFAASVPAQSAPAGRFVPARQFDKIVSPTFKNLSPRLNVSYDPFGDGKTAIKVGFSK